MGIKGDELVAARRYAERQDLSFFLESSFAEPAEGLSDLGSLYITVCFMDRATGEEKKKLGRLADYLFQLINKENNPLQRKIQIALGREPSVKPPPNHASISLPSPTAVTAP